MPSSDPSEHRYLQRVRTLLRKCADVLQERDARVELCVLGVMHVGHLFPGRVPAIAEADLVSLELPTTPVKALLSDVPEQRGQVQLRNIFWLDVLEYLRLSPPRFGVVGTNVNPHVRYLRTRLYYQDGSMANDFAAPPVIVEHPSERTYALADLGGAGAEHLSAGEVVTALSDADRSTLQRNGIVHVGPDRNPFGPARHLVVHRAPPLELLAVAETTERLLAPEAAAIRLPAAELRKFVLRQMLEGFLIAANDFYLVEALLTAVVRAARNLEGGETLRVTHVAGIAHAPYLTRYLQLEFSERFRVRTEIDPRYPLHPAYMIPPIFADELDTTLAGMSLRGEEINVDLPACAAFLERYVSQERADAHHRLLVHAIWVRECPPPGETFHTAAEEMPLAPSPEYVEDYATQVNRLITESVLGELDLDTLAAINERLAGTGRRGDLAHIGQELYNLGWTYERLCADPTVGPFMERLTAAWTAEQTRERAIDLLKTASTPPSP